MPIILNKTKKYILDNCELYWLDETDGDQSPGWQFYLGFHPTEDGTRDINWDDLPEWIKTAFINNPNLIIKCLLPTN